MQEIKKFEDRIAKAEAGLKVEEALRKEEEAKAKKLEDERNQLQKLMDELKNNASGGELTKYKSRLRLQRFSFYFMNECKINSFSYSSWWHSF